MREKQKQCRQTGNQQAGYWMDGSLTVEMTFIMPLILLVLCALLFLAFFLHDRSKMQSIANEVLHQAVMSMKHESEIAGGKVNYSGINERGVFYPFFNDQAADEGRIEEYLHNRLKNKFIWAELSYAKVSVNGTEIQLKIEGRIKTLFRIFNTDRIFSGRLVYQAKDRIYNPADFIRISTVIMRTGERIKGIKEIKDLFNE